MVEVHTLRNVNGLEVRISEYGGVVLSVRAPDREGRFEDVTLGYDSLRDYEDDASFLGALIGRYGNRIAGGRFSLDGRTYDLPINNPPNHLHGGPGGLHSVVWAAEPVEVAGGAGVALSHTSPAGDQGYPGTLQVRVTVTLTPDDELAFDYHATTDAPTPVNLTQHSYWNLAGHGEGDILDHELTIDAARFVAVDPTLIPIGELRPVEGTPFDFREPRPIGERIEADDPQLEPGRGYDHTWVLDGWQGARAEEAAADAAAAEAAGAPAPDPTGEPTGGATPRMEPRPFFAARLAHPPSGRVLEVYATEPGIQVYTGNWFDGVAGKGGARYDAHAGVALETQHFPDSPNQPSFPSTILRPGEEYRSRTVYRFTTAP